MTDLLQYGLFGLSTGALLALLGCGIIATYQGSGTVNFGHAGFAILGGYVSYESHSKHGLPLAVAIAAGVAVPALVAIAFHFIVMARLRAAGALVRIVATLALLTIIQQAASIRYGNSSLVTAAPLPEAPVHLGSLTVGRQAFYLTAIAVLVLLAVHLASRRSTFGLAVTAASQNQRAAAALGWSPDALAALTWGLGGALAGLAGALAPAVSQNALSVNTLGSTIIPALAAALLARFRSYLLVLVGGLGIGVLQSEAVRFVHVVGASDAIPFLIIVLVLVVRGTGLPVRGSVLDRLPRLGTGRLRPGWLIFVAVALVWLSSSRLSANGKAALTSSAVYALIGLSVVVVTGFTGQLSLAQFGLAGIGAWIAGQAVGVYHWPFALALPVSVLGAVLAGTLFGVPALRTRGVNLAVVTLGLGFAVQALVFLNPDLSTTPNSSGIDVPPPFLLGVHLDPFVNATAYSLFCCACLLLVIVMLCNLRRSRAGRRLLAVRGNERAAAALGVNVFGAKLYAFGLSAGIAALGGVLLAFTSSSIEYATVFNPFQSIFVVALVVIGGVGYTLGPVIGSTLALGGLGLLAIDQITTKFDQYLQLGGGVLLLLLISRDGVVGVLARPADRLSSHMLRATARLPKLRPKPDINVPADLEPPSRVQPRPLRVTGLGKMYGGVTAFTDFDLDVAPGEVVGLLGPNGAGKTSLIDTITGFVRPSSGSVTLDGQDMVGLGVHQRSRRGLSRSFQSLELFDDLTGRENLLAACDRRDTFAYLSNLLWPGRAVLSDQTLALVDRLGLAGNLDVPLESLSYGQRRLVALARAVANGPSVLLLDEPGAGLDQHETAELGDTVRWLATACGVGILLIEHDVAMVLRVADRVVVLDAGRTIAQGTPEQIRRDPAVIRAYLGEAFAFTEVSLPRNA